MRHMFNLFMYTVPPVLIMVFFLAIFYLIFWTFVLPVSPSSTHDFEKLGYIVWFILSVMVNLVFVYVTLRSPLWREEPQLYLLVLMCFAQVGTVYCTLLERRSYFMENNNVSLKTGAPPLHTSNSTHNTALDHDWRSKDGSTLYSFQKTFLALWTFSQTLLTACRCFTKYLLTTCSTLQRALITLLMLFFVSTTLGFMANTDRTATLIFLFIAPTLIALVMISYERRLNTGHYFEKALRYKIVVFIVSLTTILTIPSVVIQFSSVDDLHKTYIEYCYRIQLLICMVIPTIVICADVDGQLLSFFMTKVFGFSVFEYDVIKDGDDGSSSERPQSLIENGSPVENYGSISAVTIPPFPNNKTEIANQDRLSSVATAIDTDNDEFIKRLYQKGEMKTLVFDD